jgi:hypothetical protein
MSGAVEGVALLPCPNPWCHSHRGGPVVRPYVHGYTAGYCRVRCPVCPQIGPEGKTPAEAIAAWNTRTTPPARSYADDDQVYAKGRQDGYAAGRSHALDDAAKVAEDLTFGTEIGEWLAMTKKEVSARACHECAAAIRLLSQVGKA